jgi:hypothetical protein
MKTEQELIEQFNADTSTRNRFKVCRALNEMFPKRSIWKEFHPTSYRYAMEHKCVPSAKVSKKPEDARGWESRLVVFGKYRDQLHKSCVRRFGYRSGMEIMAGDVMTDMFRQEDGGRFKHTPAECFEVAQGLIA